MCLLRNIRLAVLAVVAHLLQMHNAHSCEMRYQNLGLYLRLQRVGTSWRRAKSLCMSCLMALSTSWMCQNIRGPTPGVQSRQAAVAAAAAVDLSIAAATGFEPHKQPHTSAVLPSSSDITEVWQQMLCIQSSSMSSSLTVRPGEGNSMCGICSAHSRRILGCLGPALPASADPHLPACLAWRASSSWDAANSAHAFHTIAVRLQVQELLADLHSAYLSGQEYFLGNIVTTRQGGAAGEPYWVRQLIVVLPKLLLLLLLLRRRQHIEDTRGAACTAVLDAYLLLYCARWAIKSTSSRLPVSPPEILHVRCFNCVCS
jgi:hypothetical protein